MAMVRVSPTTHVELQGLAQKLDISMSDAVARAVELLRKELLWNEIDAEFAALRSDPVAWQEELAERAIWDGTFNDGLENDRW